MDCAPITSQQLAALARAASRELIWGLRAGTHEIERWHARASAIPDPAIRTDALTALAKKRTHAHGAGLFWTLPRERSPELLRLLVAYELIWDLLDNLGERAAREGQTESSLHHAIADAIDPQATPGDYYQHHPWKDDGGYLSALVAVCQQRCARLPSYPAIRELALAEARRTDILDLNHDRDPDRRDRSIQQWVERHLPHYPDTAWWELSGAASTPMTIHALLALAAEPEVSPNEVHATYHAYFPRLAAATTMLDSYADRPEDQTNENHSYIAHYPSYTSAQQAIQRLLTRAIEDTRALPNAPRHTVIASAMAAMYLTKDVLHSPPLRDDTRALVHAGGTLTRLLTPILRCWRMAYGQSAA